MSLLPKPLIGALMVVIYTAVISSADGITKLLAGGYEAAQIYVFSGALIAVFSVLVSLVRPQEQSVSGQLRPSPQQGAWPWFTSCPGAMALRSLATVLAALCFFYAFHLLPFAQVFLFIGLMPLMAGILSGVILAERIGLSAWFALIAGFVGVLFLFPAGLSSVSLGHLLAFCAAGFGTFSMVMARYISRYDQNLMPQVFYPNLALCLVMLPVLPFVWRAMPLSDLGWAMGYAGLLFVARWLSVAALRLLPAYVVTPLMNLQFIWMLAIGALFFGEMPSQGTWIGGFIVIGSGLFLLWGQLLAEVLSDRLRVASESVDRSGRQSMARVSEIAGE